MTNLASDLLYSSRMLRKGPLTTTAAVLTLALGIGGTTAMFSVVNSVLLRPLPFADPERLVSVLATSRLNQRGACPPAISSISDARANRSTSSPRSWVRR